MPEFGFPAQPQMSRMSRLIAGMRQDGDDAQVSAVTGRPADLAAHLDGRVNEALLIQKSVGDLQKYGEAIALSEARTGVMQRSLTQIVSVGQQLTTSLDQLLTNGTDQNFEAVSSEGRSMIGSIVSALNTQFAGRSLFGGDEGGTNPVTDTASILAATVPIMEAESTAIDAYNALETAIMSVGGIFDTSIYQGGAGDAPSTEIAPGDVVDYTVKADEAAIRQVFLNTIVIGAAHDFANALPDPVRRELAAMGSIGLRNAIDDVIAVQARLGTAEGKIATVKARNIAEEAALSLRYNDIAGVDPYQAALRVSEVEKQLETALVTTARLSSLSLANYL